MKKIPLTQGKFALVENTDYEWLKQWKWHIKQDRYTFYAIREIRPTKGKRTTEYMHRLILGLQPGDKRQTDHSDGNGLNNQISNLRICTAAENRQNAKKRTTGTSRYKGVGWHRGHHKWQSQIQVNKKNIYLGYFLSETAAAQAYNQAALKHFGEFALLNT